MTARIGIFGGSFDPVHSGHIRYAEFMISEFLLERLFVIPAKVSPFKLKNTVSDDDRLAMCKLGFCDERITVSDAEIRRGGVSYTVDTVSEFKECYPDRELYLFVGEDQFLSFGQWYRFKDILSMAVLVGVSRGKHSTAELGSYADRELRSFGTVLTAEFEPFEISSTQIRERIGGGFDVAGMIPEAVEKYIADRGLYRGT